MHKNKEENRLEVIDDEGNMRLESGSMTAIGRGPGVMAGSDNRTAADEKYQDLEVEEVGSLHLQRQQHTLSLLPLLNTLAQHNYKYKFARSLTHRHTHTDRRTDTSVQHRPVG